MVKFSLRSDIPFNEFPNRINKLWEEREKLSPKTKDEEREVIEETIRLLDKGKIRVAEKVDGKWETNQWVKKAILLYFRIRDNKVMEQMGASSWYDKIPYKFSNWTEEKFKEASFRCVPGSFVRYGSYIGKGAILMPSFINIGANVGEGTMVDTWATIGSSAQIGKNCHISGGAGIGGVLEPVQAGPVIIEDNCFIGARSEVAEGVIVEEGSVISMGVYLGQSTKIVDRATGEVTYGRVPAYSVVVPGSYPSANGGPALYCAVIVKKVDEKTRSKISINDLLRD